MLPTDSRDPRAGRGFSGAPITLREAVPEYFRRICDFRQMDFESAFDQLLTLVSFEPHRVYVFYHLACSEAILSSVPLSFADTPPFITENVCLIKYCSLI